LKIGARVQSLFTFHRVESGSDTFAFTIPRARLTLKGNVFTKDLTYKFQTDFGKGQVALKDFFVGYKVVDKWLHFRAGQWKKPFSRQQISSSGKLQFVDRALTDKAFGAGRDIGLGLHNNYSKSPPFEYALGVFNGSGEKGKLSGDVDVTQDADSGDFEGSIASGKLSNVPDQFHPAVVARVGFNVGKDKKGKAPNGFSEVDFEGGGLRFGAAVGTQIHFDFDKDQDSLVRANFDLYLKAHGIALNGALYMAWDQDELSEKKFGSQAYSATGFHAQAGYLIGKHVQPAVRYGRVIWEGGGDQQEILGGLSIYAMKHNVKTQIDGGALLEEAAATTITDGRVRVQLQLSF